MVFVGGGYRTVSFLASQPWLLQHRVDVLERSNSFGGGAFADYDCMSTSVANRFVGKVAPVVAAAVEDPRRLSELQHPDAEPLPLTEVSTVLEDVGRAVEARLSATGRVQRQCEVTRIRARGDGVSVETGNGEVIRSRHVVIATGREERPHPALAHVRERTILSSELISVRRTDDLLAQLKKLSAPVVIAGGSHSAVAALLRLLRLRQQCGRPDLVLTMVRRSPVRLHYRSLAEAQAQRDPISEAPIDPVADVCPATGQVNRDSGLRGSGRATYRALAAGGIPGASVRSVRSLEHASGLLDEAGLVVQALGYHGRAPRIEGPHGVVRTPDSDDRLINLADGTAVIGSVPVPSLSVLRVEPTPLVVRDHGLYGQGLYDALARRLRDELAVRA
ncbi:hypothetical protein CIK06_15605 [Plantactinospora sp. KBS50]|nr:hypothetical protein CIK06_15605 [Plantactinospora sp. KBS50]